MRLLPSVLLAAALYGTVPAAGAFFQDPLDTPSQPTRLAASSQLSAVARAGQRLVAVGVRGLVLLSDDQGRSWRQVPAPVSSDLVAVRFVSPLTGWASGHDGVILATTDGGERWKRVLDGRKTAALLTAHFAKLAAGGDREAERLRREVARNYQNGPEIPILDLWFEDENAGWAVGPFGTLLATRDGGQNWVSWIEKVEGGKMLHYNAVRGVAGELYLASEQGTVYKLDRTRGRFLPLATGYRGSFFGVVGNREMLVAYGLRGTAYRSRNGGTSWQRLTTGVPGGLTGATVTDDGRLLFVSQDGRVLASRDQGDTFEAVKVPRAGLLTDVVQAGAGQIVVTGLGGVRKAVLP